MRCFALSIIMCFGLLFSSTYAQPLLAQEKLKLVILGDSLTAGYGLADKDAFPSRLGDALAEAGYAVEVVNAGVSGDTSTGGLARLDWALSADTDAVVLELGANDALRGVDPAETRRALDAILTSLKERNVRVLLTGMRAPPNMGAEYAAGFDPIYQDLADEHDVLLYPFFLEGVAAELDLNQADGIHPNPQGVMRIVERMLPSVIALLSQVHDLNGS